MIWQGLTRVLLARLTPPSPILLDVVAAPVTPASPQCRQVTKVDPHLHMPHSYSKGVSPSKEGQ
jgi:hypothetical protein